MTPKSAKLSPDGAASEACAAGVRVAPGDIVLADDTGVCFIPRDRAAEVLALARKKSAAEEAKCKAIDAGTAVADLPP